MNATQEHLLKLILEIDEICKKYDIQYFLDAGSTIGAIRHEGFLPWDDDIDIILTEDNYNKLVDAFKNELDPKKRAYCDSRLDREYMLLRGAYYDLDTMRLSGVSPFYKNLCGQFIDVFYMLELPGDPVKKQKAIDRFYAYDEYSNRGYRHYRKKTERWMRLYKRHRFWGKIFGRERVLNHLEKKIFNKHYKDCDTYLVASARAKIKNSLLPKKYFDTVYYANFEGYKLPVPGMYIESMIHAFGDTYYMVPEHKKSHTKVSPTSIGCANYVADYMRYIDKKQLLDDLWSAKDIAVEEGYRATRHNIDVYKKLDVYEQLSIKDSIERDNIDTLGCLDPTNREKLAVLDKLFEEYYRKQLNSSPLYWAAYFDIGDDLLYLALYNLIYYRYDFSSAVKILELRKLQDTPLSKEVQSIYDLLMFIRKSKTELQYGRLENAGRYLTDGIKKYPHCKMLLMDRLTLDVLLAQNESDYEKCERQAISLLEIYPDDDQGIKALGDIAWARDEHKTAECYYDWLIEHSRNGLIHLDIKKKRDANHE